MRERERERASIKLGGSSSGGGKTGIRREGMEVDLIKIYSIHVQCPKTLKQLKYSIK